MFDENGDILGSNVFFSIGGGFVINERLQNEGGGENVFYKQVRSLVIHRFQCRAPLTFVKR